MAAFGDYTGALLRNSFLWGIGMLGGTGIGDKRREDERERWEEGKGKSLEADTMRVVWP